MATKEKPFVSMRAGSDQRKRWERAASRDGRTLSEWLRRVADSAARKEDKERKG